MILYEYECVDCGETMDEVREIEDRNRPALCKCGGQAEKIISGYKVHGDLNPYYDENLETFITSKQHRQVVMREQGVQEHYGQGWYTSSIKRRHT